MQWLQALPILISVALGIGLTILQPGERKVRNTYIMGSVLLTAGLSFAAIIAAGMADTAPACTLVRFSSEFSISLRIDGCSMVYGAIVSALWPLITLYSLDYMSHEGHESRFFGFWIASFGVVLGIAFAEDFLTLYLFYELLTLSTLPLVMHFMDEKARYAGRKYLVYSLSGAAFAFIGIVFLLCYGTTLDFTYGGVLDLAKAAGNETTLWRCLFWRFLASA